MLHHPAESHLPKLTFENAVPSLAITFRYIILKVIIQIISIIIICSAGCSRFFIIRMLTFMFSNAKEVLIIFINL